MIVVKAIRLDKEEKQAIEKVMEMFDKLDSAERDILDEYLYDKNAPIVSEIEDSLQCLLNLNKGE